MQIKHPLGQHTPECSGPENCSEYAAVLAMSPTEHANYINDSTARFAQQRTASAHHRQLRTSQEEEFRTPNPYDLTPAQQAERESTSELRGEVRYKAARTREFEAEYKKAAAHDAARPAPRRLTAEELGAYAPPDSWGLKKEKRS